MNLRFTYVAFIYTLIFVITFTLFACNGDSPNSANNNTNQIPQITSFSLNGQEGYISNQQISVTMNSNNSNDSLKHLTANFTANVSKILVNGVLQESKTTQNNFITPVVYSLISDNGDVVNYTVTASIKTPIKDFTNFTFPNMMLYTTQKDNNIYVTIPDYIDQSNLIASFTTNGQSVTVNGINQISNITSNDFTNPVTYTLTATDGSTSDYNVNVSKVNVYGKSITYFMIDNMIGKIDDNDNSIYFTSGLTSLTGTVNFNTDGGYVTDGNYCILLSGTYQINLMFHNPCHLVVHALDGTTKTYTLYLTTII